MPEVRIVATSLRKLAIVLWCIAVALIPAALITDGVRALVFIPLPSIFTALFAWLVLWRPRIEITDEALVVVDVRRTIRYAWKRVQDVRTKYGIEVISNEDVRRAWTAPRPATRLTLHENHEARAISTDEAAELIRQHIPEPPTDDAPPPTTVTAAPIVHRAHGWSITALIVIGIVASMSAAQL